MTVTLTSQKIYANVTAGWTDISSALIGGKSGGWGINDPIDRVADTGILRFSLNTTNGAYMPGHASCTAGWKKGTQIEWRIVYDGTTYIKFKGVIDSIQLVHVPPNYIIANVTVVDWMNQAAEHGILSPALALNKKADEALNLVLGDMPIQPAEKLFDSGLDTFPSAFDVTREHTYALTEFAKIANSELGYLYLQKNPNSGERLIFENALHRNGLMAYDTVAIPSSELLPVLDEAGGTILDEAGGTILANQTEAVSFSDIFTDYDVAYGENIVNRIVMKAYPRRLDSVATVLYTMGGTPQIGAGEILEFNANYVDPIGGQPCGGYDMITPIATTDYTLNTLEDGTGTNLTSGAIITSTFGANSADMSIKNGGTVSGYITMLKLRGKGIYTYGTHTLITEDTSSINDYGVFQRSIDQKYQYSFVWPSVAAKSMLYLDKEPRKQLKSIRFLANRNSDNMMSFLQNDIGSLINISETVVGMSGAYFIHSIAFELEPPNIIWVTYGLVEHWSYLTNTMTPVILSLNADHKAGVNYGYLPVVSMIDDRTYAVWVYPTSADGVDERIFSSLGDGGGITAFITGSIPVFTNSLYATEGIWSAAGTISTNAWHHLAITIDARDSSANPIIYVDGVNKTVTETQTPSGGTASEYGSKLIIGNIQTSTNDFNYTFGGMIKDFRVYNRIITASEASALYNGGTPDTSLVTSGLVFQGPCVTIQESITNWGTVMLANPSFAYLAENIYRSSGLIVAPVKT